MAERKTDVYRLVMDVTTTEADPAKWNWEELLDLGADESVRIVRSTKLAACRDCGHRCDPSGGCEKCGSDAMEPGDTRCVTCDSRFCEKCGYRTCSCILQKWQVVTYDLWSDGEGGLTVNDKRRSGVIHLLPDDDDRQMMRAICDLVGGDPDKLHVDNNTDNTGGTIYILDNDGNPACELVREN